LKKNLYFFYFVGLFLLPVILLFLPANYFDSGKSLCISKLLFQQECPGCGITRACQHAMHFQYQSAWEFNKLVIIVFPLLIFLWFKEVITTYRKIKG